MAYDNCLGENLWDWLGPSQSSETKKQCKIRRKTCTVSNYFVGKLRNTKRFLKGPCQIWLDTTSVEACKCVLLAAEKKETKLWIPISWYDDITLYIYTWIYVHIYSKYVTHSDIDNFNRCSYGTALPFSKHFHNFKATSNICTQITQLNPKSHPESSPKVPIVFAKQGAPNIWQPNQRTPQTWPCGVFRAHEFGCLFLGCCWNGVCVDWKNETWVLLRVVLKSSDWNEWQHQWWKQEYPLLSMMVACENIEMSKYFLCLVRMAPCCLLWLSHSNGCKCLEISVEGLSDKCEQTTWWTCQRAPSGNLSLEMTFASL